MKLALFAGLALLLSAGAAAADPIAPLRVTDLNGGEHLAPHEWPEGGVLIMGFSHQAREPMDQWVEALGLNERDAWLEIPVIGTAAPTIARPMIRSSMRRRYGADARRAHVAPVFDNADDFAAAAGPHQSDVVVLVLNAAGEIAVRIDGETSPDNVAAVRRARTGG